MSAHPAQPEPGPGAGRGVIAPQVSGGPYGTASQLAVRVDDLRRFAAECQRWLDGLTCSARTVLVDAESLPRPGEVDQDDPARGAAVAALMSAVGELELLARVGSPAIEARLWLLSHHLELAATAYETGEELNRAALIALDECVAGSAGLLASTYPDRPVEISAARRLSDRPAPTGIADLFALLDGEPTGPAQIAGVAGSATASGMAGSGGVAAEAGMMGAIGGDASTSQPEPQGPPSGRLDVWRLDPNRNTYVVAIPGTSSWTPPWSAPDDPDVRNLGANLALVGHEPSAEVEALPRALAQAGVPVGATLILVGHSQGGLTAYAAAGSRAMRDRFRVSHVLTAGSPVAGMPAPAGVRVLSLERRGDVVPALDGRDNLDRPEHLTVRFELEQDLTDRARQEGGQELEVQHSLGDRVGEHHGMTGYRRAGSWSDVSTDAGLIDFRASLAEVGVGPADQPRPASVGTRVVLAHPVVGQAQG